MVQSFIMTLYKKKKMGVRAIRLGHIYQPCSDMFGPGNLRGNSILKYVLD
jgi:hypothetical protein